MPAFASPAELASYLQQDVDTATAALLLDMAAGIIQAETRQTLSLVTNDTVSLAGLAADVFLPQSPVVSVGAVTAAYFAVPPVAYAVNLDYSVRGGMLSWRRGGWWPDTVNVTYTHGYAVIPSDVKAACVAIAAESYQLPGGLLEQVDDYVPRLAGNSPAADLLAVVVRRYRRRAASVLLR